MLGESQTGFRKLPITMAEWTGGAGNEGEGNPFENPFEMRLILDGNPFATNSKDGLDRGLGGRLGFAPMTDTPLTPDKPLDQGPHKPPTASGKSDAPSEPLSRTGVTTPPSPAGPIRGADDGVVFEEPPRSSRGRRSGPWIDRLLPVKERPGEWARVMNFPENKRAGQRAVVNLKNGTYTRPPGGIWGFTSRRIDEGSAVWAIFWEDQAQYDLWWDHATEEERKRVTGALIAQPAA